jgi:hypothetical protein
MDPTARGVEVQTGPGARLAASLALEQEYMETVPGEEWMLLREDIDFAPGEQQRPPQLRMDCGVEGQLLPLGVHRNAGEAEERRVVPSLQGQEPSVDWEYNGLSWQV